MDAACKADCMTPMVSGNGAGELTGRMLQMASNIENSVTGTESAIYR